MKPLFIQQNMIKIDEALAHKAKPPKFSHSYDFDRFFQLWFFVFLWRKEHLFGHFKYNGLTCVTIRQIDATKSEL